MELHEHRGSRVVVARAPPEEALDPQKSLQATQALRFPEIDAYAAR